MEAILNIKEELTRYLTDKFRIAPKKTIIKIYNLEDWIEFCKGQGIDTNTYDKFFPEGLYCVRDHSANIVKRPNNPRSAILPFLHEYFGHGLYMEYSLMGKKLDRLEQKLLEEETNAKIKGIEQEIAFEQKSQTFHMKNQLYRITLEENEGFAMWMESHLSELLGIKEDFEERQKRIHPKHREIFNDFAEYEKNYGEYAVLYSCGLEKHYNIPILDGILKKLFRDSYDSIDFAVIYGSRSPHSDIDIFMVSDKIRSPYLEWIDINSVTHSQFEELASKLDISITDPLFTGEFICGDRNRLEQARIKILEQPITAETISHHKEHAKKAEQMALEYPPKMKEHHQAMRYSKSYLANARELEQNRKPLTLGELISRYPEEFQRR